MVNILKGPSITKHQNPKKLMIMLHGYGDNATNFIQIANLIDQDDLRMKYVALMHQIKFKIILWDMNGFNYISMALIFLMLV